MEAVLLQHQEGTCPKCEKTAIPAIPTTKITPDNAHLVLFLDYQKASHVEAKCLNGHTEIIYVTTQVFLHILAEAHLSVAFGLVPTDERKAACDATWGALAPKEEDEVPKEPDPPHWMLRELFDDLRNYEGSN